MFKKKIATILIIAVLISLLPDTVYAESLQENAVENSGDDMPGVGTDDGKDATYDGYDVSKPHIIINQIYGAGNGGYASHSFIELYNPTDADVDISGWSLQYRASLASAINTEQWSVLIFPDDTIVPQKTSYLIRCKADSEGGATYSLDLSNDNKYDMSWDELEINTKGCAVVLRKSNDKIGSDSVVFDNVRNTPVIEGYVDMLAVSGSDVNNATNPVPDQAISWYEGSTLDVQSKKKGFRRINFTDTDNNAVDAEAVNYSKTNIDEFKPRSLSDGAWPESAVLDKSIRFSAQSGFYQNDFDLTLNTDVGKIYYTLNGSEPNPESESTYAYDYNTGIHITDATANANTNSMRTDISAGFELNSAGTSQAGYAVPKYNIDKCTVVRAAAYYDDGTHSNIYTHSYFVGFDGRDCTENLNILSITVDPDDLFDYEKGIYVLGKTYEIAGRHPYYWWWANGNFRNKGADWERKASLEFFDVDGNMIYDQVGGIRIHGGGSRGYAQKSFNIYARAEYDGNKRFNYDFFGTGYKAKKLTLSSGGDDTKSKSADYVVNTACDEDENYSIAHMLPYALFLNGEYWGMYYLSEKYDDKYIENYYGVKDDNVVMIKNGDIEEGNSADISLWSQVYSFIVNNDMELDDNYQQACKLIDIDSYVHYYATETYIGRWCDWPVSNYAMWRCRETGSGRYEDGKWRWMLFDLNSGSMGDSPDPNPDSITWTITYDAMFKSLMYNPSFREKFSDVLSDIGTQYFSSERMTALLADYKNNFLTPLEVSHDRYYGLDTDSEIEQLIDARKAFFDNRYDVIMGYMNEYLTRPKELLVDKVTHIEGVAADCTHSGTRDYWRNERTQKIYGDSNCATELSDIVIPATGHQYESQVIAPTPAQNGYTLHTCTACGDTYQDSETAPTGTVVAEVPASCTESGIKAHWLDTATGKLYADENYAVETTEDELIIPATGHQYESQVIAPTPTQDGYTLHTCTVCGDTYQDSETEPTGTAVAKDTPSCTKSGIKAHWLDTATGKLYADENYTLETTEEELLIPATGHQYAEEVIAPTVKEKGYTLHTCTACGDTYQDSETEPTGTAVAEVVPSCTKSGIRAHWLDTATGKLYADENYTVETTEAELLIPAAGHQYADEVIAPAVKQAGYTIHTCIVCGDTYRDAETQAAGVAVEEVLPTCTETGLRAHWLDTATGMRYSDADYTVAVTEDELLIPATGHQYVEKQYVKTSNRGGYYEYTCSICGDSYQVPVELESGKDNAVAMQEENPGTEETASNIHKYTGTMLKGQKYNFGSGAWTTSDKRIIAIGAKNGSANAKKAGTAVLKNTDKKTGSVYEYTITVVEPSLSAKKLSLMAGQSEVVALKGADNLPQTWISSDATVATVMMEQVSTDRSGTTDSTVQNTAQAAADSQTDGYIARITAVGKGTAQITAYVGGVSYTVNVTVKDVAVQKVTVDADRTMELRINAFQSVAIRKNNYFKPSGATWTESDGETALKQDSKGVWTDQSGIISITKTGRLTGTGVGTVTVIGTDSNGNKLTLTVEVAAIPVKSELYVNVGRQTTLKHTYVKNGKNDKIQWTSSEESVAVLSNTSKAKVTIKGNVTGTSVVTCVYNGVTYTTVVHVEDPALATDDRLTPVGGNTAKQNLKYNIALRSGECYDLQQPGVTWLVDWKSSKQNIVSVDEFGRLTARSVGKATISAKVNGQTVKIAVTVK